jgi:hypothetical protein
VQGYAKRGKSDALDAEAICEAVQRPTMRFVRIKTVEQQAILMAHRTRSLRVRQRTMPRMRSAHTSPSSRGGRAALPPRSDGGVGRSRDGGVPTAALAPRADPADVIRLVHDGPLVDLRLVSIANSGGTRHCGGPPGPVDIQPAAGDPRAASLTRGVLFDAPDAVLMDQPQLTKDQPAHRRMVTARAVPWPGEMAVFRSPPLTQRY